MRAIAEHDRTEETPEEWRADHSEADNMIFRIFRDDDGQPGGRVQNRVQAVGRMRAAVGTNFRPVPQASRATLATTGRPNLLKAESGRRKAESTAIDGKLSQQCSIDASSQDAASGVRDVAAIVAEVLRQTNAASDHRMFHPGVAHVEAKKLESVSEGNLTLREFYAGHLAEERARRVANGRNKRGTSQKDLAALSFWERLSQNPTLSELNAEAVQEFIGRAIAAGRRSTASGYVGHLRWILNEAKRAGILERVPAFQFPKVSRRAGHQEEQRQTLIYEIGGDLLGTLGKIFEAIEVPELKLAFLCGASFGPRTEDLLTLQWSSVDLLAARPVVRYVAEKTGTYHVVPLAPFLVGHLERCRTDERWLFPSLISHGAAEPAKSRACRRTVATLRSVAASVGFDFSQGGRTKAAEQKPFQILRATCNERFERHHARAGEWILGHAMNSLNRKSYQNPGSEIFSAVLTLPQPTEFLH